MGHLKNKYIYGQISGIIFVHFRSFEAIKIVDFSGT